MRATPLVLCLAAFAVHAQEEVTATSAPDDSAVVASPETAADEWPGEGRRVHFGIGARVHSGVLSTLGNPYLLVQSELLGVISIRVFGHHEWRVQFGIAAGWPDTLAGESSTSFRFHLTPRWSVGVGAVAYWGFWSMRGGLEVPISIRLGATRRHEISLVLRTTAGVFNSSTLAWYDLKNQRFAIAGDAAVAYSFIF